jgi:hypothetical protein
MFVAGFVIGFFAGVYVCHRLCINDPQPRMKVGSEPVLDVPTM